MLYEALQKENLASEQDLDLDDITSNSQARCSTAASAPKSKSLDNPDPIGGLSLNQLQEKANQVITYEWVRVGLRFSTVVLDLANLHVVTDLMPFLSHGQAKELMCDYKPGILENSAKMVLLFHLIEESVKKGDKILVFR